MIFKDFESGLLKEWEPGGWYSKRDFDEEPLYI